MVDLSYSDIDLFFEHYYLTDHHWKIGGAVAAYRKVVEGFGRTPARIESIFQCYGGPFWGAAARSELCPEGPGDSVDDIEYRQGSLSVAVDGEAVDPSWLGGSGGRRTITYEKTEEFEKSLPGILSR